MNLEVPLDSIEFLEPSIGKTPEIFDAIDVDFSLQGNLVLTVDYTPVSESPLYYYL